MLPWSRHRRIVPWALQCHKRVLLHDNTSGIVTLLLLTFLALSFISRFRKLVPSNIDLTKAELLRIIGELRWQGIIKFLVLASHFSWPLRVRRTCCCRFLSERHWRGLHSAPLIPLGWPIVAHIHRRVLGRWIEVNSRVSIWASRSWDSRRISSILSVAENDAQLLIINLCLHHVILLRMRLECPTEEVRFGHHIRINNCSWWHIFVTVCLIDRTCQASCASVEIYH